MIKDDRNFANLVGILVPDGNYDMYSLLDKRRNVRVALKWPHQQI